MIQRQQTLWLLLAAVASFLTFQYPFYTGTLLEDNISKQAELEAGSNFFLLILTGLSLLIAAIAIFLFKDRKTQFKLSITGTVLSLVIIALYIMQMNKFTNGRLALTSLFVVAIFVGFAFASRGIWKDEKLVKSLDKLR